ncbi:two-component system response regulator [Thermodesulfobacteriota bacterium]
MADSMDFNVLVVDDTETNIDILVETLGDDYDISVAMDGESALEDIADRVPDLILLDIMMPGMDGYEVCERLKSDDATKNIPVIFLTAMTEEQDEAKGLALGAVDYVTKPFSPELVKSRVRNQLELKRHRDHLEELVQERTMELILTQDATIYALATLAEYRDPETGGHIRRTQNYVLALAEHLQSHPKFSSFLDDKTIALLYKSAPLHDIGKVGVQDSILLKPGKLTDEEFDEMKNHTTYGHDTILKVEQEIGDEFTSSFLSLSREIAYTHQEKWNGSGYPRGLKEEAIPISGRLMAVADVYDALISKRVYKPPFPNSKAVAIIEESKGNHFDPDMVDAFLELEDNFREIALEHTDFDEEREALSK